MNEINEKWINIDEAAEYMGVKPGTVRGWLRKDKSIPAHKIGNNGNLSCPNLMHGLKVVRVKIYKRKRR